MRYEAFTAMKVRIVIFGVTLYSPGRGYQYSAGTRWYKPSTLTMATLHRNGPKLNPNATVSEVPFLKCHWNPMGCCVDNMRVHKHWSKLMVSFCSLRERTRRARLLCDGTALRDGKEKKWRLRID